MKTYKIIIGSKTYKSIAVSAIEAMEKLSQRLFYGKWFIVNNYSLKMYDSETRGEKWAQYQTDKGLVMVSL